MFWVNGLPCDTISLTDRSFQYGDGCFTTILTRQGKIKHWQQHQQRMQRCLDQLFIEQPNWKQVHKWLDEAALKSRLAGLRLNITRGTGGRGYSPNEVSAPNIVISTFSYPEHYQDWAKHGIELGVCAHRLGINPVLAGHKHNNRLEQVLTKRDMDEQGLVDGVVLNIHDYVIETTMANLFWVTGETLYTPSLANSGVAGVMRQLIIERAQERGIPVQIGDFTQQDLDRADEMFMTNSICTVIPVIKLRDNRYPIGLKTRDFQEIFRS
ncbi:aminodeoxychorismate lyase [Vibrio genomosp. F10]|uniref:aminodeoxychorismate lyase n=1 Tax=Vibrio genomosp. F10 TaxID=723171 RepID=UPI0002E1F490|nr:aminodeoxychorismate lyase [Vibrio genomosp. F10]OEF04036.1 aminodeoxychorismate lyase [Vibrio genomosp. F10 str. 9ZB36]